MPRAPKLAKAAKGKNHKARGVARQDASSSGAAGSSGAQEAAAWFGFRPYRETLGGDGPRRDVLFPPVQTPRPSPSQEQPLDALSTNGKGAEGAQLEPTETSARPPSSQEGGEGEKRASERVSGPAAVQSRESAELPPLPGDSKAHWRESFARKVRALFPSRASLTKREVKIVLGTVTAATLLLLAAAVFGGRFTPGGRVAIEDAVAQQISGETELPPKKVEERPRVPRTEPRTMLRVECAANARGDVRCSEGHRQFGAQELAKAAKRAGVSLHHSHSPEASFEAARQLQAKEVQIQEKEVRRQNALIDFRNALMRENRDGGAPYALQTGGQKSDDSVSALRYASLKATENVSRLRMRQGERTRLRGAATRERMRQEAELMAPAEAAASRLFAHTTRLGTTTGDDANMRRLYEYTITPSKYPWLDWRPWSRSTPFEALRNEYVHRAARGDSAPLAAMSATRKGAGA
jgi:hypothetical protein